MGLTLTRNLDGLLKTNREMFAPLFLVAHPPHNIIIFSFIKTKTSSLYLAIKLEIK